MDAHEPRLLRDKIVGAIWHDCSRPRAGGAGTGRGERQREVIAIAKQRGAYRGRKKALSEGDAARRRRRAEGGDSSRSRDQPRNALSVPSIGGLTNPLWFVQKSLLAHEP